MGSSKSLTICLKSIAWEKREKRREEGRERRRTEESKERERKGREKGEECWRGKK